MVTAQEILNRQSRGGITFMPPVRPQQRRLGPPVTNPMAGARPVANANAWVAPNMDAIAANQARQAQQAQGGGGGPSGLGWIVGGLGKLGMGALTALDMGRRAAVLGTEEMALALPTELEWLNPASLLVDEAKAREDTRSAMERLKDPHYGFGEIAHQFDFDNEFLERWANRGVGLAGDIALDPLTYLTAGVGGVAGKTGRGVALAKLAEKQAMVERLVGEGVLDASILERLGGKEALERIGSRGVGTANPFQLKAMGLDPQGVRFAGKRIPGSGAIGRATNEAVGALRPAMRALPGATALRKATTRLGYIDQDMVPAFERMLGRGDMPMDKALNAIKINETMRRVGGGFEGLANRELRVLARKTKHMSSAERSELIREAELGADNVFSQYAGRVREAAKEVGYELPELKPITKIVDGQEVITYQYAMPHSISREFRDYMKRKITGGGDETVENFKRQTGITNEDLLEEGGFLQKRQLRPNADGTPYEYKIGDRSILIEEGSVDELNRKLAALFPDYKGKIYETDPIEAWRRYINVTKKDVADRVAFGNAAREGVSGIDIDPGPPLPYDPMGGREPMAPRPGTPTTGAIVPPVPGEVRDPLLPGIKLTPGTPGTPVGRAVPNPVPPPESEFYKMVPEIGPRSATEARDRALLRGDQPQILADFEDASLGARQEIAAGLDEAREAAVNPIREKQGELLQEQIAQKGLADQAVDDYTALVRYNTGLSEEIKGLDGEIRNVQGRLSRMDRKAERQIVKEQRQILDELVARRTKLVKRQAELEREFEQTRLQVVGRLPSVNEQKRMNRVRNKLLNTHSFDLEAQYKQANRRFQAAKRKAVSNYAKWSGRMPPTETMVEEARQVLREAGGERVRVYAAKEAEDKRLVSRIFSLKSEAQDLMDEADMLNRQMPEPAGMFDAEFDRWQKRIQGLRKEAKAKNDEARDLTVRRSQNRLTRKESDVVKAADTIDQYNEFIRYSEGGVDPELGPGSSAPLGTKGRGAPTEGVLGGPRLQVVEAKRQIDDWEKALNETGWKKGKDGQWRKMSQRELDARTAREEAAAAERRAAREKEKPPPPPPPKPRKALPPTWTRNKSGWYQRGPYRIGYVNQEGERYWQSLDQFGNALPRSTRLEEAKHVVQQHIDELERKAQGLPEPPKPKTPFQAKSETINELPPVEEGMVRLYRGDPVKPPMSPEEARAARGKRGLDWISESEEMQARDSVQGRWFTTDKDVAARYPMNRNPDEANILRYVDIPQAEYDRLKGLADQPDVIKRLSADPKEVVLPPEHLANVQDVPVGSVPPAEAPKPDVPVAAVPESPATPPELPAAAAEKPPTPLPPKVEHPPLTGGEIRALNEAKRKMSLKKARDYAAKRDRLERLNAMDIENLKPGFGTRRVENAYGQAELSSEIRDALTKERDELTAWMAAHPDQAAKYDPLIDTMATLTKKQEAAETAARLAETPPAPTRSEILPHPELQRIENEIARQQAESLEAQAVKQLKPLMPEVEATKAGLAATANPEAAVAEPMLRIGQDMITQRAEEERLLEGLLRNKGAARTSREEINSAIHGVINDYQEALVNQDAARREAAELKIRVGDMLNIDSAERMVQQNKTAAKAARVQMERFAEGKVSSYEAQPMHRVLDDIEKLVRANPLKNDAEMNRIEAQLHSLRKALEDLTTDIDMPLHEQAKMLKAAKNGTLAPVLVAQLDDTVRRLWTDGDVLIRRDVEKMYRNIRVGVESKGFGRLMTLYTNFFKTYATLSPGFHIRNAMSAIFMNFTEGVPTGTQIKALRKWREFANVDDPIAWLQRTRETDPAIADGIMAVLASGSGGQFFESGVGELSVGSTRLKEGLFANRATKGSQRFGQDWIEGPARLSLALHSTSNGGSIGDALNRITRIHFDYTQVSEFDEKAKRYIPFWTFTSRNMPLQVTQMWMRPRIYNRYQSIARNLATDTPLPFMPEYIAESGAIDTGEKTPGWLEKLNKVPVLGALAPPAGMPIVLQPDLPHLRLQQDLARFAGPLTGESPSQVLSELNPAFTAPLEYITGQDVFTGQRFGPEDMSPAGLLTPIAPLLSQFGAARKGNDGKWYIQDKAVNALLATIPPLAKTERLAPGALGQTGTDPRLLEQWLRFNGVPIRTISDQQQQSEAMNRAFEARDRERVRQASGG